MKKILIITGDGGESYETLYAIHRFLEAGYQPIIAAPTRKRLHMVVHDFEQGWDTYAERQGYGVESQLAFDEVKAGEYLGVLLIGGRAPEYLRNDERVLSIIKEFDNQGSWIFALCHGVQILARAGLVKGRRVTAYEHVRHDVEMGGGEYVSGQQAVRDGKVVTGQTWQSHPEFYREVFLCLGT